MSKLSVLGLLVMFMIIGGCALLTPSQLPKEKTYEQRLLEVAKQVPEFGGLFFKIREDNLRPSLYLYLLDLAKKDEVEAALKTELDPYYKPGSFLPHDIYVLQAQYSFLQLQEWRDHIVEKRVQGVSQAVADETTNRIVVWLEKGEMAALVAQELAQLGIPREAVLLVVKFTKYTRLSRELEVPPKALVGEKVQLRLKVKNLSGYTLYLYTYAMPIYNIIVAKPDGTEMWCRFSGGVVYDPTAHGSCDKWSREVFPLEPTILEPNEELEFTEEWDQSDFSNTPVPPGTYWVHGVLAIGVSQQDRLETAPKPLVIEP